MVHAIMQTEADQPVSSYSTAALSKRLPTYAQPKYMRTTAAATTASAPKVPLIIHSAGCSTRTTNAAHSDGWVALTKWSHTGLVEGKDG